MEYALGDLNKFDDGSYSFGVLILILLEYALGGLSDEHQKQIERES